MKKIGFVIPWFGFDIPGGAEAELKGLVLHLSEAGVPLEVLTTCVHQFQSDWSHNYHRAGTTVEKGITVRRFKARRRDEDGFNRVNRKLMNHELPLTDQEERTFVREMVNSPSLYRYIGEHKDEYSLFVFIPYMFGTTYFGIRQCMEKAVLIPCFHDESYVYMRCFKRTFSKAAGMIFHAQPEADLAARVYRLDHVNARVLGEGVYTEYTYDAARFRRKYGIDQPFILYAGRKDVGKNIYTLINYFHEYKYRNDNQVKLVLIGGGEVKIPKDLEQDVMDLGFVDVQDKFDAYGAALVLCQPSINESFSLVIMESWICGRPVLVHDRCKVTKHFAKASGGGLYFGDYFEFEGAVNYLLEHPLAADAMGRSGQRFVMENFAWDVITDKYISYFEEVAKGVADAAGKRYRSKEYNEEV